MKDEFGRVIVNEFIGFIGLKSKMCIQWKKLMVKNIIQQKE